MKKSIYITTLALAGILAMNSCNDDEFLAGNPSMEVKTEDADALFGDSLPFTIKASDVDVPLSTLKAQLFYGEEQVSETVIRTKTSGSDYVGKIYVPYYANIPNGKATLKYVLQNIHFTTTEKEMELTLARPDFPYLTLVDESGQEYRMNRESMHHYSASGDFSQKMKAYIKTPKVGVNGNELTFGWEENTIQIGSTTSIPFSNTEPGNYTIQFNTFNYEASPFAKLLLNGKEMELIENDVYALKLSLKQNEILTFEGVHGYDEWWIDADYFEKREDGTLKFLPIDGNYKITANSKKQYFSVNALKDGEDAKLQSDGTGAIWLIGNGVGKPSVSLYEVGWTPENGLCMPQHSAKKYQLTFTAGATMKADNIDFKFFHINKWDNGEFKGDGISTTSELVEVTESGNVKLQKDKKFERGGVYKFTIDVTKGNTKAVLTVEKVGQVDLPRPDITINGTKLEEGNSDMYQLQMPLTPNQTLEIGGIDNLNEWYIDPDYLVKTGTNQLKFLPVAGSYRVMANATRKYFAVVRMNGSDEARLDADGHGAVWLLGYGLGSPSVKDEFNWDFSTAYCVAEISPKVYQFTGKTGTQGSLILGERIRYDYVSFKYMGAKSWDQQFHQKNLQMNQATRNLFDVKEENFVLASPLEQGATYVFTLDFNQGVNNGVLTVTKK